MARGRLLRTAATASMVSSARTNRAVRKNIEQQNNQTQNQSSVKAPQDDLTTQLEQLNELKNKGLITQEEFDAKKKQILGI